MRRFFVPSQSIAEKKIIVSDPKQAHYIRDVLRLKIKGELIVFDEKANEYVCAIERLKPQPTLFIKKMSPLSPAAEKMNLAVACAIPKKSNMDDIVDKLTQLGVGSIIPLKTRRTIVKLDEKKKQLRLSHWQKVAQNAGQQSRRIKLPVIEPIQDIKEVLSDSQAYDLKLIPTLEGQRKSLKEILDNSKAENILVLIGPEGDFTDEEVALAKNHGCIAVSLGRQVLRVETAAVAVASYIKFRYQS
jgi:16S rRNA (uracil1498-N3)-methyltransferase